MEQAEKFPSYHMVISLKFFQVVEGLREDGLVGTSQPDQNHKIRIELDSSQDFNEQKVKILEEAMDRIVSGILSYQKTKKKNKFTKYRSRVVKLNARFWESSKLVQRFKYVIASTNRLLSIPDKRCTNQDLLYQAVILNDRAEEPAKILMQRALNDQNISKRIIFSINPVIKYYAQT